MKSIRTATLSLLLGASLLVLASCGKSSSVTSPTGLSLDTTPPSAPTNVHGWYDTGGSRDYLSWDASASADVAGYQVWKYSGDPSLGGVGTLVNTVDLTVIDYALPLTATGGNDFYRVRAIDASGNVSAYSATADVVLHAWSGQGPNTNPPGGGAGRNL